jgi:RimJ/RimL family protein N-acetyltransferase
MSRTRGLEGQNVIYGRLIYLRPLNFSDVATLMHWMEDPEVVRYLSASFLHHLDDIDRWIRFCTQMEEDFRFGIVDQNSDRLIGIIVLYGVNHRKRCAQTGMIVGEKAFWKTGRAWEAKILCLDFAFRFLNLRYVFCKVNSQNSAALKHLERCGYLPLPCGVDDAATCKTNTAKRLTYFLYEQRWRPIWNDYLERFVPGSGVHHMS